MLSLTVLILSCLFTPRGGTVSALPSAHMEAHVAIPKRGAAALLKSKMFHEMKRQGKDPVIDSGDLTMLKERLMARLSGKTLVETKLFWKNRNEKYEEVAVVGSWGQWMALHELDKVNNNMWEVTVNIPVGEHQFKFLIDGVWHVSHEYAVVDDNVGTTGNNYLQVHAPTAEQEEAEAQKVELALQALKGDQHEELKELHLAAQELSNSQSQKDSMKRMAAAARRARTNAKASDDALQRASKALAQEMARSKAEVSEMQEAYARMRERTEELKKLKRQDQENAAKADKEAKQKAVEAERAAKEAMERQLQQEITDEKAKMRRMAEEAERIRQEEFERVRLRELDGLRSEREALEARKRGWLPEGLSGPQQWKEMMGRLGRATGIDSWFTLAEAFVPALALLRPEAPAYARDVSSRLLSLQTFPRAAGEVSIAALSVVKSAAVLSLCYLLLIDLFYVPEHLPTNLMKVSRSTIERRHQRNPEWNNARKIHIAPGAAA